MKQRLSICVVVLFFCFSFTVPTLAFAGSTADANAGAIAESEATAIGGLGIGVGGNALAETGPSSASIKDLSSSVKIEDNSITKVKNINRQFPNTIQPQAPAQMQYFGPWQMPATPWNMFPVEKKQYSKCEVEKLAKNAKIDEKNIKIFLELLPQNRVSLTESEPNPSGKWLVGYGVVRGKESAVSYEVLAVLLNEAMENGANIVVIKAMGWQQKGKSGGWHIGIGAGASGVIGADEKMAIQGAGGTGFGSSSITAESMPWIQAVFYRDGNVKTEGEIAVPTVVPKTKDISIQEKFSPISSPSY